MLVSAFGVLEGGAVATPKPKGGSQELAPLSASDSNSEDAIFDRLRSET